MVSTIGIASPITAAIGSNSVARNIEIKARVPDPAALRQRVAELSAKDGEVLLQRDTFYAVPSGRLKLREFDDGSAELIFYERPDQQGPKLSSYVRTPVIESASMRELLGRSLKIVGTVRKRRQVFLVGNTRIHLDEVEGLGTFVELEVVLADGEVDADGEAVISLLMRQLGIRNEYLIEQAYVDLWQVAVS
jgi:predicted adenylyl cyclase CyaB